jgi:hypothetical protein
MKREGGVLCKTTSKCLLARCSLVLLHNKGVEKLIKEKNTIAFDNLTHFWYACHVKVPENVLYLLHLHLSIPLDDIKIK